MKKAELNYDYPEELIATEPVRPSRVMWVELKDKTPIEMGIQDLLQRIPAGDAFVINNTKVLRRRLFTEDQTEVLFLDCVEQKDSSNVWKVLFPSKKVKLGDELKINSKFTMKLLEKGRPQIVEIFPAITEADFDRMGELPLPPYIQKARQERHNIGEDELWYQTRWAQKPGSMAAPTASLHFSQQDLQTLKSRGVHVVELTLHVGLGTFLPVTADDLSEHQMHSEQYEINESDWQNLLEVKNKGHKIWALGTTVTRVLESIPRKKQLFGSTDLLLQEGSEFLMVDRLLTNFHQPESTLLALVAGFAGLDTVRSCYRWAIEKKFRLFSYGDLSVWSR